MACAAMDAQAQNEDWMGSLGLNPAVYVSQLSIPGTHDAATGTGVSLSNYSTTQELNIEQQLAAGVRAFDLRPTADGTAMNIYHGLAKTNLTLQSALQQFSSFLDAHPQEMLVIVLRHETDAYRSGYSTMVRLGLATAGLGTSSSSDNYNSYLAALLSANSSHIVAFRPTLTYGEARGKMVILSRNEIDNPTGCGIVAGWHEATDFAAQRGATISYNGQTAPLYLQDYYDCNGQVDGVEKVEIKKNSIRRLLAFTTSGLACRPGQPVWVINHTSAYSITEKLLGLVELSTTNGYRANATHQNAAVIDYLTAHPGPAGIIMMDFAGKNQSGSYATNGQQLIDKLIDTNRSLTAEQASVEKTVQAANLLPARDVSLRAPAVPLIANDPFFQAWSAGDQLNGQATTHWNGEQKQLCGFVRVDGQVYRFMGTTGQGAAHLEQATTTLFADGNAEYKIADSADGDGWTAGKGPFANNGEAANSQWQWTTWGDFENTDVYVRATPTLSSDDLARIDKLILHITYDQDPHLYINGIDVWSADGWCANSSDYRTIELPQSAINCLVQGENTIMVKAGRGWGGQFLDFYLYIQPRGYLQSAQQNGLAQVLPTQTHYSFTAGPIDLNVAFTNPQRPDDLSLLATPIDYISYQATPNDGRAHDVQVYLMASPQFVSKNDDYGRNTTIVEAEGLRMVRSGHDVQAIEYNDAPSRADWGYLYLAANPDREQQVGYADYDEALGLICRNGSLAPRATGEGVFSNQGHHPMMLFADNLGHINSGQSQYGFTTIGYDYDGKAVHRADGGSTDYANYNHSLASFTTQLKDYVQQYADRMGQARSWDETIYDDALQAGGQQYAEVAALAYRQTAAAHMLAQDDQGQTLLYNMSTGFYQKLQAADVVLATAPLWLAYNPALAVANLLPALQYYEQNRSDWTTQWAGETCAPHTLGPYPWIGYSESNWRLESDCNYLVVAAAALGARGDVQFFTDHYATLADWAAHAKGFLDRGDMNVDTFDDEPWNFGRLNPNQHMRLKAILAMAAMAQIAQQTGHEADATTYDNYAQQQAALWKTANTLGDHYRQSANGNVEWGQKYALAYDRILGSHLFDDVAAIEAAYYAQHELGTYGLPMDARTSYAMLGESYAAAALCDDAGWLRLTTPLHAYVGQTTQRVPLRPLYNTTTAMGIQLNDRATMNASPMVGLLWTRVLLDKMAVASNITGDGGTTAIQLARDLTGSTSPTYNLNGQRVDAAGGQLRPGIYIRGGKKVVVR